MDNEAVLEAFGDAFNRKDVDAVMALMTDDCVHESTDPAPDGVRHQGQAAVRAYWVRLFEGTPVMRFDNEDVFVCGDRATVRWTFSWDGGHVRGVDVFRFRDGKVAEKLSYVKG